MADAKEVRRQSWLRSCFLSFALESSRDSMQNYWQGNVGGRGDSAELTLRFAPATPVIPPIHSHVAIGGGLVIMGGGG